MLRPASLWLCLALTSPLVHANAAPEDAQVPTTLTVSPTQSDTDQQMGYWQTAASSTVQPTSRLSFRIDVMKWHEQMNAHLVAPAIQAKEYTFAIRGAYNFSGKWQGYLQLQNRDQQPTATEALAVSGLNGPEQRDEIIYSSGLRFTFPSGIYMEGAIRLDSFKHEAPEEQLQPRLSFGYHF